tara:strand:+ start:242 stop:715 length:474 start_codon:yes stop_codon:yes gene_type:complete
MVLEVMEWMSETRLSLLFGSAVWYSPLIQVAHLVAVAVFAGALLVVDLRLLGTGLTQTPVKTVAEDAQPWLMGGLIALTVTGLPSLFQLAIKQYYSPFWWWKMEMLALGLIFIFTVRRKVLKSDEADLGSFWPKVVGLVSMALFLGVTIGARLIGLS